MPVQRRLHYCRQKAGPVTVEHTDRTGRTIDVGVYWAAVPDQEFTAGRDGTLGGLRPRVCCENIGP